MPMPTSWPGVLCVCASALLGVAACVAPSEPADTAAKAEPKPKQAPAPAPEPEGNDGFSSAEPAAPAEPGPPPPWFSPSAFEHAAVIRQDERANLLPTGQSATMIVLELPPGTNAETCMANAKAKLGETIPQLAEQTTTPQGYLTIKGKTSAYEYTVVCGVAKDKPTMFLSVVQ